jgi:hypothetical protein
MKIHVSSRDPDMHVLYALEGLDVVVTGRIRGKVVRAAGRISNVSKARLEVIDHRETFIRTEYKVRDVHDVWVRS